ncbi:MAG: ATP-binding protein [Moraxellaceae bacterium]|jgi:hypothetical protein|nr:ATP-binding protein [Moraxellaceae bacterium]
MKDEITRILQDSPWIKAKDIAKILGKDKKDVNPVLYAHEDIFTKNSNHEWRLIAGHSITIVFDKDSWTDCDRFEEILAQSGCLLSSAHETIIFVIPKNCKLLLEAMARLLALVNQLAFDGRTVKVDFSGCRGTLSFLNRIGFIDKLNSAVDVLPERPKVSAAKRYEGNSDATLEICEIVPANPDREIPKKLKNKFVSFAGDQYTDAAFTIISELFGNVCEHSDTPIPGFVALQRYSHRKRHLQTVVSDSGKGIVGTLRPALEKYYPKVFEKLDFSDPKTEVRLLQQVLRKGKLSQTGESGRGLGLSQSQNYALRYSATISVRQETFELKLFYKNNSFSSAQSKVGMPRIMGTHVCFDFILD